MFRTGGTPNQGIMHGLVDRKGYAEGPTQSEIYAKEFYDQLSKIQPPKPRFNMGEMGINLASGEYAGDGLVQNIVRSAKGPYSEWTKADDARGNLDYQTRIAAAKYGISKADAEKLVLAKAKADRKKGFKTLLPEEAKLALKDGYDPDKTYKINLDNNEISVVTGTGASDERTNLMKELEAAGIFPGSDEYKEAMRASIFKESKTTAERNALALGLVPGTPEYNDYIKGATIKTDIAADRALQGTGIVLGKPARDKLVQNTSFVETVRSNLDDVTDLFAKDPSLSGFAGTLRRISNKLATGAEDFGVDIRPFLPKDWEDKVFDTNIAKISALEELIAPAYARVIFPNQRMTNFLIKEAKDKMNLTGATGSAEVLARLAEVKRQFDIYLENNQKLLGNQPTLVEDIKNWKIVDGNLVEKK